MEQINAIGRRKSAVARVYLTEGTGKITINKRDITEYFPSGILQYVVKQPLQLLDVAEKYDIKANLDGGGFTGQSQALRLAIARALVKINAEDKKKLERPRLPHTRRSRGRAQEAGTPQGSQALPVQQALMFGSTLPSVEAQASRLASKPARPAARAVIGTQTRPERRHAAA